MSKAISTERLMDTEWAQWKPYNYSLVFDPSKQNDYCIVGCPAIAVGQLLFYWIKKMGYRLGAPRVAGYKSSKSYRIDGNNYTETYIIDYSPSITEFDYENILNRYSTNTSKYPSTKIQRKAICDFLAYIGKLIQTSYSTKVSSAPSTNTAKALQALRFNVNHYATSIDKIESVYGQRIRQNLDNGYPILIRGVDPDGTGGDKGHIWVCDGYKYDSDKGQYVFHMNWGQGGYGGYGNDNYCPLSELKYNSFLGTYDENGKPQYGTNPGEYNYRDSIEIMIDIYPKYINGDIDNNGEIDSEDIIAEAAAFINNSCTNNELSGDVNYDNKINEDDIIYTYRNIMKDENKDLISERIVNLVTIEKYCKQIEYELETIINNIK